MRQAFKVHSHISIDARLIKKVQHGDKQAFDQLVQKYQCRILKLVSRYIHEPADAMDIAQESFIKAYRALNKFRGDSAFYTWLYRIAINTAKNHVITEAKKSFDSTIEIQDAEMSVNRNVIKEYSVPEKNLLDDELETVINEVIKKLPDDLKMAITLREVDGLTYEEIAGVMDCPIGTVRSRIFRAREAIERRIKPLFNI